MPLVPILALFVPPVLSSVLNKLSSDSFINRIVPADLRKEMEVLRNDLEVLQTFLKDLKDPLMECTHSMRRLVCQTRDVTQDLSDVIDACQNSRTLFLSFRSPHWGRIWKLKDDVENLMKLKDSCGRELRDNRTRRLLERRKQLPAGSGEGYESCVFVLKKELDDLMSKASLQEKKEAEAVIVGGSCCVIPIVGMGGQGKTTLASKFFCSEEARHHFQVRVWLSATVDSEMSLMCIHGEARPTEMNLREQELGSKLRELWTNNKGKIRRGLIVLDDVGEVGDAESKLEAIYRVVSKGSTVLLTTRSMHVAERFAKPAGNYILLRGVDEADCWKLVANTAGRVDFPENLRGVGIIKKCQGLPLALVQLGGVIKSPSSHFLHSWEGVLNTQEFRHCLDVLGLSYRFLDSSDLKACFLYLALFPNEDRPEPSTVGDRHRCWISASKLKRLWRAEGFVGGDDENARETHAENSLQELINRNMVHVKEKKFDGSVRNIYITQLMLEFCKEEAKEDNFLQVYAANYADDDLSRINAGRLAVHNKRLSKYIFTGRRYDEIQKVRSLFGFNLVSETAWVSPFPEKEYLRVIDVYTSWWALPHYDIQKMVFLRYLRWRCTTDDFSEIDPENLKLLEVFDVNRGTFPWSSDLLRKLNALKRLKLLRHIKAEAWMEKGLPILSSLRKLGIKDITYMHENVLKESLAKLDSLVSLTLESRNDPDGSIPTKIFTFFEEELHSLKVKGPLSTKDWLPPCFEFPSNLKRLVLQKTQLEIDPLQTLEKLPKLVHLELRDNACVVPSMHCNSGGFPKLEYIVLDNLPKLSDWTVDEGAMPSVTHVTVRNCDSLSQMPENLTARVPGIIMQKVFADWV